MFNELAGNVLVAVVTAFLTVRLSLRSFYTQKWWEKQAEAYSGIMESLSPMKRHTSAFIDQEETGESMSPEKKKLLFDRWRESKDRIEQASSIGAFIISDGAEGHLLTLQRELSAADKNDSDWLGTASREWDALDKAMKAIRQCAKGELQPKPFWKRIFSN